MAKSSPVNHYIPIYHTSNRSYDTPSEHKPTHASRSGRSRLTSKVLRWEVGSPACAARQVWMHSSTCSYSCCCACAPRLSATRPWAKCDMSPPFMTSAFVAARAKQPDVGPCQSCFHRTVRLFREVSSKGNAPTRCAFCQHAA